MTVVVDHGSGNLFSIGQALRRLGVDYKLAASPREISRARRIILPGVGAFGNAMQKLNELGLADSIVDTARSGVPTLGICLGMQLLMDKSDEFGEHIGLGLIPGHVKKLAPPQDGISRIPNVGWRTLRTASGNAYLAGFLSDPMVYFVHSHVAIADDDANLAATINFGGHRVPAIVQFGNIVGYQFHPEKSGDVGLSLIDHFIHSTSE